MLFVLEIQICSQQKALHLAGLCIFYDLSFKATNPNAENLLYVLDLLAHLLDEHF